MVALEHSAPFTVADLFTLPEGPDRFEVLDGQLLVSPAPGRLHQLAADAIRDLLRAAAPPHAWAVTAVAVRCGDEQTGLVPDVTVTTADPYAPGAIDASEVLAVVEVVSPSSRRTDRLLKPEMYAAAGIGVYWRVELAAFRDQAAHEKLPVVLTYELAGDRYQLADRAAAGRTAQLTVPFPLRLDPASLLP